MAKFRSLMVSFLLLGVVSFHQAGAQGPVPAPSSGADVPVPSTPVAPVAAPVAPVVVTPEASPASPPVASTPTPSTIPTLTPTPSASPIPTPTHSPAHAPTSEAPAPGPSSAVSAGTRQVWSGMAMVSALAAALVL